VSSRRRRAAGEIGTFLRQYGRSSRKRNGYDPNDRDYDRKLEQAVKRMPAEELDRLMHGDPEDDDST
jgi:hypothetical protein